MAYIASSNRRRNIENKFNHEKILPSLVEPSIASQEYLPIMQKLVSLSIHCFFIKLSYNNAKQFPTLQRTEISIWLTANIISINVFSKFITITCLLRTQTFT